MNDTMIPGVESKEQERDEKKNKIVQRIKIFYYKEMQEKQRATKRERKIKIKKTTEHAKKKGETLR